MGLAKVIDEGIKKQHKSKKSWLNQHLNDRYVRLAQKEGYRARSAYKLIEIDKKERILRPHMTVVELGAAPGGWSQVVLNKLASTGRLISVDILPIKPLSGMLFIQGDFCSSEILHKLKSELGSGVADLVISDISPNISGISDVDQANSFNIAQSVLNFSSEHLKKGGNMLIKVFSGGEFADFLDLLKRNFFKIVIHKPEASRSQSREVYLLGIAKN